MRAMRVIGSWRKWWESLEGGPNASQMVYLTSPRPPSLFPGRPRVTSIANNLQSPYMHATQCSAEHDVVAACLVGLLPQWMDIVAGGLASCLACIRNSAL